MLLSADPQVSSASASSSQPDPHVGPAAGQAAGQAAGHAAHSPHAGPSNQAPHAGSFKRPSAAISGAPWKPNTRHPTPGDATADEGEHGGTEEGEQEGAASNDAAGYILGLLSAFAALLWRWSTWAADGYMRTGQRAVVELQSFDMGAFAAMSIMLAYGLFRCLRCCRRCRQSIHRWRSGYVVAHDTEESDDEDDRGSEEEGHSGSGVRASRERFSDGDEEEGGGGAGGRAHKGIMHDDDEDIAPPLDAVDRRFMLVDAPAPPNACAPPAAAPARP